MSTTQTREWGASSNRVTFGDPYPGRFGNERPVDDPADDDLLRVEDAYALTLRLPDGSIRHIDSVFGVDPTREHTALSDWKAVVPAQEGLDEWLHADAIITFDERVIYRGKFEDIDYSSTDLTASISGRGAGASLDSGSYQVYYDSIEDWRAIQRVWDELTDFDAYVSRPNRSVAIDEFEAEGTPLQILQELHEDYNYRFVIDQREPRKATSFKVGDSAIRQTTWRTLDDSRSRSVVGYHNQVTVVGARKADVEEDPDQHEATERYRATAENDREIARMAEMGIDTPIEWHERDRSLESDRACRNRAEAILEELVQEDERTGSVTVFPRLVDPGPSYTVDAWDDERAVGAFSLLFDGSSHVELPSESLEGMEDQGAVSLWIRPGLSDDTHGTVSPDGCAWGNETEIPDTLCIEGHGTFDVHANGSVVQAYPDGAPRDAWSFVHIDWSYDSASDSTLLRAGYGGQIQDTETVAGRINLPPNPSIGADGTDQFVGYVDDLRYYRQPLAGETDVDAGADRYGSYPWIADKGEPRARHLLNRWAFNEYRALGGDTIYDMIGGDHGTNHGAEYAGEPKQLESLSFSESDGSASCQLNFERIPSPAADLEALRRETTKLSKQI